MHALLIFIAIAAVEMERQKPAPMPWRSQPVPEVVCKPESDYFLVYYHEKVGEFSGITVQKTSTTAQGIFNPTEWEWLSRGECTGDSVVFPMRVCRSPKERCGGG